MRRLTAADYVRTRWKNGQGETTQLAVVPSGAGLDDFVWRVSIASIVRNGPFSNFPNVDRSLVVLAGAGVALHLAGTAVELQPGARVFSFAGDELVHASLVAGPVRDFNVMTRRASASHKVVQVWRGYTHAAAAGKVTMLFAIAAMQLVVSGQPVDLGREETLLLDPSDELEVRAGRGLVVAIHHHE